MCGYVSHQDPRLQPPVEVDGEPDEPMDFETCRHGEACRALLARLRGWDANDDSIYWMDQLAKDLGCEQCKLFEWGEL